MTAQISPLANEYVQATNDGPPSRFLALFAEDAIVRDAGRELHGRAAIRDWSQREIFDVQVTIDNFIATPIAGVLFASHLGAVRGILRSLHNRYNRKVIEQAAITGVLNKAIYGDPEKAAAAPARLSILR